MPVLPSHCNSLPETYCGRKNNGVAASRNPDRKPHAMITRIFPKSETLDKDFSGGEEETRSSRRRQFRWDPPPSKSINGGSAASRQLARAFSFAGFAHRHRKRYESSEEIQRRFQIYSENLRTIRSHNKKGLSYTMGVNGDFHFY